MILEDGDGLLTILGKKNVRQYLETFWLRRIYRGLISNLFDLRVTLFCGHRLTFNCTLVLQHITRDFTSECECALTVTYV